MDKGSRLRVQRSSYRFFASSTAGDISGGSIEPVSCAVTLSGHLAEASCRDRQRPARSALCRAARPVISVVQRRFRGCPPVTQATDPVVIQRNAPGLFVRPRSRRRLPRRSVGMLRQDRSPQPSRGGPLLQVSHRAAQCRRGSSTRSDTTSVPAVAPDRRRQPQARPHGAGAVVATRCGLAESQGGMLSARQRRDASNVELAQGLTRNNLYLLPVRGTASLARGLGRRYETPGASIARWRCGPERNQRSALGDACLGLAQTGRLVSAPARQAGRFLCYINESSGFWRRINGR
jgi:hypothetical protein